VLEIHRREQQLREAAAGDQIGDGLAGVRKEDVRAHAREQRLQVLLGEVLDEEQTRLLDLREIDGALLELQRDGHREADLVDVALDRIGLRAEVQIHLGLPFLGEHLGRVRRLE